MVNRNDLRVVKTMDAIHTAFEDMIRETDYGNISVTELCRRARINKKTFYRYYASLDELFAEFQTDMSTAYIEATKDFQLPRDIPQVTRAFFEFLESNPVYSRITCVPAYRSAQQNLTDTVVDSHWHKSDALEHVTAPERTVILAFVRTVGVEIYRQWVADGRKVPLERIIEMTSVLQSNGLNALLRPDAETIDATSRRHGV